MQSSSRPLSILQVASAFDSWGGTELHILNLSQQLTAKGHSVTIACQPGSWVEGQAKQMDLPTLPVSMRNQRDVAGYRIFRKYCQSHPVDVLHAHSGKDAKLPPLAARIEGVPVRLLTRHVPWPFHRVSQRMYSGVLFNKIVTVSNSVGKALAGCGVPENKITVIHHGTDVSAFQAITIERDVIRQELGLAPNDIAVGILGRISSEKGHNDLFESLRILEIDLPVKVVVVGDGPQAEATRIRVNELGIGHRVIFTPFRTDVNNMINALDIVTVPSTWQEPCSAVIQQAMALSKPVIGTNVGGTPEVVLDRVTGLIVPANNPAGLAEAITTLANQPQLRAEMGETGAKRVEEFFSLRVMTDRVEALYFQEYSKGRGGEVKPFDRARAAAS